MKLTPWIALALAAPVAAAFGQSNAGPPIPPGAKELVGELLRRHAYILGDEERSTLDAANRRLREAEARLREAREDAERLPARSALEEAVRGLIGGLETVGVLRRVTLTATSVEPSIRGPHELDRNATAFLWRVTDGEAGTTDPSRFTALEIDQSLPENRKLLQVECAPGGVTWVLLGLHNLPVGRSTIALEMRRGQTAPARAQIDVVTPELGRLKVTILSDDTERPAPAMVRLTSRLTGHDHRPGSFVDFTMQFDGNGRNTSRRAANLPGRLGGEWWCVSGPFDTALPPGQYDLAIRRGVERVPLFERVTVRSGAVTEMTYRPERWIDMPARGWYSGDDHVHGQILSDADAGRLMAWVQAEDIHLANIVKMGDIYRTYFEQRGFGETFRVRDGAYILSPGQECPRTHQQLGHTISMNTQDMVRDTDRYYLYDLVADEVHRQGGLWGYAHVCLDMFHVHRDMSLNVLRANCDFVELMQFRRLGTKLYYDFLNLGFRITASAGSDVPWGGSVGEVRVFARIGDREFGADAWFEAFRGGRTFVTNGPMIELTVDGAGPGEERVYSDDRSLKVTARAWGHPDRCPLTSLEVVRHGEVIHSTGAKSGSARELEAQIELPVGGGFWIAARAHASNDTHAHTSPVFVRRNGLRFWKLDAVDSLIDDRLESLRQIEQIVEDARERADAGQLEPSNREILELAEQGDALMERVTLARELYAALRQTATRERTRRATLRGR